MSEVVEHTVGIEEGQYHKPDHEYELPLAVLSDDIAGWDGWNIIDVDWGGEYKKTNTPFGTIKEPITETVDRHDHYNKHPSGVECIEIIEWLNFNLGCAVEYVLRSGEKGDPLEDLRKAKWYIEREIARLS